MCGAAARRIVLATELCALALFHIRLFSYVGVFSSSSATLLIQCIFKVNDDEQSSAHFVFEYSDVRIVILF